MKKIILLIIMTIFSSIVNAQIKLKDDSIVTKDTKITNKEFKNKDFSKIKEITIKNGVI